MEANNMKCEKETVTVADIDTAYELVGTINKYTSLVIASCCLSLWAATQFMFSLPYFLLKPPVECLYGSHWKLCTPVEACAGGKYRLQADVEFNFVTEFDLLCRDEEGALLGFIFFLASFFSSLFCLSLSDIYGRLRVMVFGHLGNILSCMLLLLFPSLRMCQCTAAIIGLFSGPQVAAVYSFAYDSCHSVHALINGTILSVSWGLCEIWIVFIMFTGISWRTMLLCIIGVSVLFFVLSYWVRESPRFHYSKLDLGRAESSLRHIADVNGVRLGRRIALSLPVRVGETKNQTSIKVLAEQMCCNPMILSRSILSACCMTSSGFAYYIIALNLEKMSGNIYINGFLTSVAEIPCYLGCLFVIRGLGKKLSIVLLVALTSVSAFVQSFLWESPTWNVAISFVIKFCATGVDNLLTLFVAELFPTSIKAGAFGLVVTVSRISSMVAKPMGLLPPMHLSLINAGLNGLAIGAALFLPLRDNSTILDLPDQELAKPLTSTHELAVV